jgi:hypothetical protein
MKKAFPLTRDNIHLVAGTMNIPAADLWDQLNHAKSNHIREGKIEAACSFFGKDRIWYDTTMEKVREFEKMLPEGISNKERIIKMYGWIEGPKRTGDLRIPFQMDHRYAHALAVEAILTDYDSYIRMTNWD